MARVFIILFDRENISTIQLYQVCKKCEARYDHKMNIGYFLSTHFYDPFIQKLDLGAHFETIDEKSDSKDDRTTNTNLKEVSNYVNGKVVNPDVGTVDLIGGVASQGFSYENYEENITSKFFCMSALPEGGSIYYILPEAMKLFHLKEGQNMVSRIQIQMVFFAVANNVVPVEDILDITNFDNTLTEAAIYNARICCRYIAWDKKTSLYCLNEANNGFTWMKFFTQG